MFIDSQLALAWGAFIGLIVAYICGLAGEADLFEQKIAFWVASPFLGFLFTGIPLLRVLKNKTVPAFDSFVAKYLKEQNVTPDFVYSWFTTTVLIAINYKEDKLLLHTGGVRYVLSAKNIEGIFDQEGTSELSNGSFGTAHSWRSLTIHTNLQKPKKIKVYLNPLDVIKAPKTLKALDRFCTAETIFAGETVEKVAIVG